MREEVDRRIVGGSETFTVEREPPLRFRVEYQMGDLICFVSYASNLYVAAARMAAYDPERVFNLRVVDTETDEIIPDAIMEFRYRSFLPEKLKKVNWTKEGF